MKNFEKFEEAYTERFGGEDHGLVHSEDGQGNPLLMLNGSFIVDVGGGSVAFSPSADRHPFVTVHEFELAQEIFGADNVTITHANAFNNKTGEIVVGNDQVLEYLEGQMAPQKEETSGIVTGSNKLVDASGREL